MFKKFINLFKKINIEKINIDLLNFKIKDSVSLLEEYKSECS